MIVAGYHYVTINHATREDVARGRARLNEAIADGWMPYGVTADDGLRQTHHLWRPVATPAMPVHIERYRGTVGWPR